MTQVYSLGGWSFSCCPNVRALTVDNSEVFLQTSTKQSLRASWLATFPSMLRSKTSRSFAIQKEVYALLSSAKYVYLQPCVQFLAKSLQDAASASIFLKSLQNSSPRPFLGRMLRYEPARAFRTLLISYRLAFLSRPVIVNDTHLYLRKPFQIMTPEGLSRISVRNMPEVPLDLPNAIRIWKPRNTK